MTQSLRLAACLAILGCTRPPAPPVLYTVVNDGQGGASALRAQGILDEDSSLVDLLEEPISFGDFCETCPAVSDTTLMLDDSQSYLYALSRTHGAFYAFELDRDGVPTPIEEGGQPVGFALEQFVHPAGFLVVKVGDVLSSFPVLGDGSLGPEVVSSGFDRISNLTVHPEGERVYGIRRWSADGGEVGLVTMEFDVSSGAVSGADNPAHAWREDISSGSSWMEVRRSSATRLWFSYSNDFVEVSLDGDGQPVSSTWGYCFSAFTNCPQRTATNDDLSRLYSWRYRSSPESQIDAYGSDPSVVADDDPTTSSIFQVGDTVGFTEFHPQWLELDSARSRLLALSEQGRLRMIDLEPDGSPGRVHLDELGGTVEGMALRR